MRTTAQSALCVWAGAAAVAFGLSGPLQHFGFIPKTDVGDLSLWLIKAARGTVVKDAEASCTGDISVLGPGGFSFPNTVGSDGLGSGIASNGGGAAHGAGDGGMGGGPYLPPAALFASAPPRNGSQFAAGWDMQDLEKDAGDLSCLAGEAGCKKRAAQPPEAAPPVVAIAPPREAGFAVPAPAGTLAAR